MSINFSFVFVAKNKFIRQQSQNVIKICRTELTEIETCSECYYNANTNTSWFVEACDRPHLLVWAKLKGFPFWPAKAMSINGTQVDVRFFGEHDRAWIPNTACLLYSEKDPNPLSKSKKNNISDCIKEVDIHIEKLKKKFGAFSYAEFRSPLELNLEKEYIQNMLPNLRKAALKTEMKSKSLTLKFVKQPGLATENDTTKIYQVMNNNSDESEQVRSMILKRKDNWKSFPVQEEEESPTLVPVVPRKGKNKIAAVVENKNDQRASGSKEAKNSNKFQRVYSAASGLLGLQDVELKKTAMKRRKSTRPVAIVPSLPPNFASNDVESNLSEPTKAPEGRKINAHSRKTRSKSGPLEPSDEPLPKSARMTARLKTMKPQDTEVTEASGRNDPEFSLKGVKSRLKSRLKSIRNVTHSEKENQVEKETNQEASTHEDISIKKRRIEVEPEEEKLYVTIKQEPMSDDEHSIRNEITQTPTPDFSINSTALELMHPQKPLHQYPVARKARKTFPKKLPVPIMPSAIILSHDIDQITTVNSMVCIPLKSNPSKPNPSKSTEVPPLVAMCQPSTSSSSSSKQKSPSIHPNRTRTPSIISLENNKPTIPESVFPISSTNGDSFQKSSFLPNMSTGLASAIADTILGGTGTPPKLTRRPSHPLHSDGTGFQRDCGPFTRTLIENSHRLTDHFRKLIEDILYNISQTHPEATVHQLRVEIEELNDKHKKEITDLKRNTGESFSNNFKSLNQ